jgi:serine/threonine-protein kinase
MKFSTATNIIAPGWTWRGASLVQAPAAFVAHPVSPAPSGIPFGRYLIRRRLAKGGMGEVFVADQLGPMGPVRPVALKRMLPQLSRDPSSAQMFLAEMGIAAQLNHPNIAVTYDFGEVDGVYFIAMEYIEGVTLKQLLESQGPLPIAIALEIAAQIADALAYAHRRRSQSGGSAPVVHRDVSPHNVMVSTSGAVKLLDFGIARAEAATLGGVHGKVAYCSPEHIRGMPPDRRSDLWSLGVVLFESVAGVQPYPGKAPAQIFTSIIEGRRPLLGSLRPEAARLEAVIARALEPRPEDRWPSGEDFAAALRQLSATFPRPDPADLTRLVAQASAALPFSPAGLPASTETVQPVRLTVPAKTRTTEVREVVPPEPPTVPSRPGPSRWTRTFAVAAGALALLTAAAVAWVRSPGPIEVEPVEIAAPLEPATEAPPPEPAAEAPVPLQADLQMAEEPVTEAAEEEEPKAPAEPRPTSSKRRRRPPAEERAPAPGLGLLSVRAVPWSQVSIDGRELGASPIVNHPLDAGEHELSLVPSEADLPAKAVKIRIKSGQVTRVLVDFRGDTVRIEGAQ